MNTTFIVVNPAHTEVAFNEVVSNIDKLIEESNSLNIDGSILGELNSFKEFIDTLNFMCYFENNPTVFLRKNIKDALDRLKLTWLVRFCYNRQSDTYKFCNSVYDVLHEFYYEE